MTTTINPQDIVKTEVSQFAQFLCAYLECSEEVRAIVDDMASIVRDPDSTPDERGHAVDVMVEALVPGLSCDVLNQHREMLRSKPLQDAQSQLDEEERAFADRVRELMADRGMTQEQLAERTGVSQPAISNILNRRCRPQGRTIQRFAEGLGVSPESLWPKID